MNSIQKEEIGSGQLVAPKCAAESRAFTEFLDSNLEVHTLDRLLYKAPNWRIDGARWISPEACMPMPTTIARIYTPEGFVIAADGRKSKPDGTVITDSFQKIFPLHKEDKNLAYVLAGAADITPEGKDNVIFDFAYETAQALSEMSTTTAANLYDFAGLLSRTLEMKLRKARIAAGTPLTFTDRTHRHSTSIFIEGYFHQEPQRVTIEFFHDYEYEKTPHVSDEPLESSWWGSKVVSPLIFQNDDRFARYTEPFVRWGDKPRTLIDAIAMAKNYVAAHCDAEAHRICELSRATGGHVHLATITPKDGFNWVPGFRPHSL